MTKKIIELNKLVQREYQNHFINFIEVNISPKRTENKEIFS